MFSLSPGGTVSYQWTRNGVSQPTQMFALAPGVTSASVTDFSSLSQGDDSPCVTAGASRTQGPGSVAPLPKCCDSR
jgi:hypothetical protein